MLQLDRIAKRHAGVAVLQDVTLHVRAGECVGLAGMGGSARSTLLRIAATLTAPDSGDIVIGGVDARRQVYRARLAVAYVGGPAQAPPGLHTSDYIRTAVARRGNTTDKRAILDAVARTGLGRATEVVTLPPGPGWRLALIAALAASPRLLLIDDPLHDGDETWRGRALEWIASARDSGVAVVIASDGRRDVEGVCTRLVRLDAGRLVDPGPLKVTTGPSKHQAAVAGGAE